MYNADMGTPRKHKLTGSTGFLARPRLGALKNIYSGSKYLSKPIGVYGLDKKKKIKKPPQVSKLEFRKKPDYADNAYREAVSRLRILLAESYIPVKRSIRELDSGGEETDNQSVMSGISRVSRYPHYHPSLTISKKYPSYTPRNLHANGDKGELQAKFETTPEMSAFIERQEDYIEQLERESRFCRDELSTLLSKVKDVISENECLHEKQKNNIMKSVFDQFETETETENEIEIGRTKSPSKSRKTVILEGPSIVFESRISELEAQLTQTKIDLKKAQEENDNLKRKLVDSPMGDGPESLKKMESLHRDKAILQETVSKLQAALNLLRDKEHNTSDQVKRSLDVAEQAQYEKSAAEHEIRRLKDELERQHGKLREAINEQGRRVADERSAVERRYSQQIEQLTAELGVHWEQSSKHQLEVDKQRRENADLRRELAQKQALIDELKKEMQNKIITLQSDIGVSGAEKSALEQQISSLQMANERCERQAKQETARLQVEMTSLRQRLDRGDADLIHSRRENIRLSEQVAGLEKEINLNAALAEEKTKRQPTEAIPLPPPKEDMSVMIKDMEAKHVATVAELEGMIQSQNQLMDKLSSECHALTQKLEESSSRHKEEIRELQTNLDFLSSRFSQSQIKSSNAKDDDSTSRNAPHEPKPASGILDEKPFAPSISRTSSKSSIQPQEAPQAIKPDETNQYYNEQPTAKITEAANKTQEYPNTEQTLQVSNEPNTNQPNQENVDPNTHQGDNIEPNKYHSQNQEYIDPNTNNSENIEPIAYQSESQNGQFIDPNSYQGDNNDTYQADPQNGQYIDPNTYQTDQQNAEYVDPSSYQGEQQYEQQYDPNQEYMTQEQYDQQYGQYDPNAQYVEGEGGYTQENYDPQQVGEYNPEQPQYVPQEQTELSQDEQPKQTDIEGSK